MGDDIFLDFLNRDSRQLFRVYSHLTAEAHTDLLARALNFCVFMTRDACVMPPGFLAEDRLVRRTFELKEAFRDQRLVLLPIRETLDAYWAKKEREYALVRTAYEGLFDAEGQQFVAANYHLLIDRPFEVGVRLVDAWEAAPDASLYWRKWLGATPSPVVELFRRIPRQLLEEGRAITWATISSRLEEMVVRYPNYRRIVQHVYFSLYLDFFDLKTVTHLPLARDDFGLGSGDLFYDYSAMQTLLEPAGIFEALLTLEAEDIVALRKTAGYFSFRRLAFDLCQRCGSLYELREFAALEQKDIKRLLAQTEDVDAELKGHLNLSLAHGELFAEALGVRLAGVVELELQQQERLESAAQSQSSGAARARAALDAARKAEKMGNRPPEDRGVMLAIFAALVEERDILVHAWQLTHEPGRNSRWSGQLPDGTTVLLYSADLMGRVPAAVQTSLLLSEQNADLSALLVLGIAGGFAESKVQQGHLLVPYEVADLANRKVTGGDLRLRPEPFPLDRRLGWYLNSQFDFHKWSMDVTNRLDWPKDRRPSLSPRGVGGTLASVDEVVASDSHRAALLQAWPDLLGVEMECGGVAAAVRTFRPNAALPVFQLRVVSDIADPAKSDDNWRKLGVRTLADLVGNIRWRDVMTMKE